MRDGELTLPPTEGSIEWPSQNSAGELALVVGTCVLTSSATTQAQRQGFELAHPNITSSINCWGA